jgi:hypothetical protein
MRRVEFEPTIPAFEGAKTVYALDRGVTVIGAFCIVSWITNNRIAWSQQAIILFYRSGEKKKDSQIKRIMQLYNVILVRVTFSSRMLAVDQYAPSTELEQDRRYHIKHDRHLRAIQQTPWFATKHLLLEI